MSEWASSKKSSLEQSASFVPSTASSSYGISSLTQYLFTLHIFEITKIVGYLLRNEPTSRNYIERRNWQQRYYAAIRFLIEECWFSRNVSLFCRVNVSWTGSSDACNVELFVQSSSLCCLRRCYAQSWVIKPFVNATNKHDYGTNNKASYLTWM